MKALSSAVLLSLVACSGSPSSSNKREVKISDGPPPHGGEVRPTVDGPDTAAPLPPMADASRGLMLTDPEIVKSDKAAAMGPWSFGTLIRGLLPPTATDDDVTAFIQEWLTQFSGNDDRSAKVQDLVLCPWRNASSGHDDCRAVPLDLSKAPFQLIGIVNRMDLKLADSCLDAGELRFVFALAGDETFNVNFEFAVPTSADSVSGWAGLWAAQSHIPCTGTADCERYLENLQGLTGMVTPMQMTSPALARGDDVAMELNSPPSTADAKSGAVPPPTVPASNLRHLRIHEKATGGTEFREFVWSAAADGSVHLQQSLFAEGGMDQPGAPIKREKCQGCHTEAGQPNGPIGERFNVLPDGAHHDILAQLPDRMDKVNALLTDQCPPSGQGSDAQRSVPW